jgi:hypothetical protein
MTPHYEALCEAYSETLVIFYTDWMLGRPLAECIEYASNPEKSGIDMPLPVPANSSTIKTWEFSRNGVAIRMGYQYTSEIRIVGHSGLTVTGLVEGLDGRYPGL